MLEQVSLQVRVEVEDQVPAYLLVTGLGPVLARRLSSLLSQSILRPATMIRSHTVNLSLLKLNQP
jgi:hypothetical protein